MQTADTNPISVPETPAEGAATLVDIDAAHRESNLDEILDQLDRELVGLTPVKAYIRQLASLLLVSRLREQAGLGIEHPTLHMSFTGAPGTGKTSVAMRMAAILPRLGYSDTLILGETIEKLEALMQHAVPAVVPRIVQIAIPEG